MSTRIDWMQAGKEHWTGRQDGLTAIFAAVDWQEFTPGVEVAMMPGLGIQETIKQLRIPKVSHFAISNELAPFGLYGIRGHFENADVDFFVADAGSVMHALAAVVSEK
jgi:hypothetical protein